MNVAYKVIFNNNEILCVSRYEDFPSIMTERTFDTFYLGKPAQHTFLNADNEDDAIEKFNKFHGTNLKKK